MPEFKLYYSGFKNAEDENVLKRLPDIQCAADADSEPGDYPISITGAETDNYDITYIEGVLSVTIPDSYVLTYLVDGEVYRSYNVTYKAIIIPEVFPTKEGYTFSGWSEIPETMPAHDVTIYASYTTGIEEIVSNQKTVRIFGLDGKPRKELQKGVNIILTGSGTKRIIVVK